MTEIFFTSDTHFGHNNIIKYCSRPFKNLDEMNNTLINNWNSRVKKEDIVFHLGDFCFKNSNESRGEGVRSKAEYWLSKLNGKIIIVRGNHDNNNSMNTPIERIILNKYKKKILLLHNPQDITQYDNLYYDYILCGHVHNKWDKIGKIFNVGVDVNKFMPVKFNELIKNEKK